MRTTDKTNFLRSARKRLLPKEPYEMTYWKKKQLSFFRKVKSALKELWGTASKVSHS